MRAANHPQPARPKSDERYSQAPGTSQIRIRVDGVDRNDLRVDEVRPDVVVPVLRRLIVDEPAVILPLDARLPRWVGHSAAHPMMEMQPTNPTTVATNRNTARRCEPRVYRSTEDSGTSAASS